MPIVFPSNREPIQRIRVQIGEHYIERATSGEWTPEQAAAIALEMVNALTVTHR